jgi:hypothetical protein
MLKLYCIPLEDSNDVLQVLSSLIARRMASGLGAWFEGIIFKCPPKCVPMSSITPPPLKNIFVKFLIISLYQYPKVLPFSPGSLSKSWLSPILLKLLLTKEIPAKGLTVLDNFCDFHR